MTAIEANPHSETGALLRQAASIGRPETGLYSEKPGFPQSAMIITTGRSLYRF